MGGLIDIEQNVHHDSDHMVTKVRCKNLPDSNYSGVTSDVGVTSIHLVEIMLAVN